MKKSSLQKAADKAIQQFRLLEDNPGFQKDVATLRGAAGIPPDGLTDREAGNRWYAASARQQEEPLNILAIGTTDLLTKYRLPVSWWRPVRMYVLYNDTRLQVGPTVSSGVDESTNEPTIQINAQSNTTLKDIEAIWPLVTRLQGHHPYRSKKKIQPMPKYDRDKRAFELRDEGLKLREIAELLSNESGEVYGDSDVAKFIERHGQKVGITQR